MSRPDNMTRAQRELLMEAHELAAIAKVRAREARVAARKAAEAAQESADALNKLMHGESAFEPLTLAQLAVRLSGGTMPRWVGHVLSSVQGSAALGLTRAATSGQALSREVVLQSLSELPLVALHALASRAASSEGVAS